MSKVKGADINTIESGVMSRIHDSKPHIRSRFYYLSLGLLLIFAIILMIFVSTYSISVASLWLRLQAAKGPAYGLKQNLSLLLDSFPVWALFLGSVSMAGAVYLIRKSGKMYKLRLAYFVPLAVAVIATAGFVLSYSSLPNTFGNRGLNGNRSSVKGYQRDR